MAETETDIVERLRDHCRFAAEDNDQMKRRKMEERQEGANEIERLRALIEAIRDQQQNIIAPHAKSQADEIERLRGALSWIADHDPQIVDAAREKFGIRERG